MVNSGAHVPSSANQGDAASLASEFESLSADYQNVIRFAQHRHGIRVVPLQELKGGFTGAFLYLVSVSSPGSGQLEHLVLKLDRPSAGEPDELERHKRALEQAPPDFAREHMAEVAFDRVELDGAIAIFYRIAGESLHGFRPLDAFQQQSQVQAIFSVVNREILTRWNAVAAGFDQAVHPQSLLSRWLTDRLGPERNIEKFFKEVRRIDADRPGLIVQGRVYPNPLLFAREADLWGRARPIDAIVGFQHGDMNVNNVLVKFGEDGANLESYYLIDFAFFEERMPLLYDQAYLEIAFLLPYVATVDFARWVDLVTGFASQDIPDPQRVPIELAGAAAAISAGRREFDQWIRANHMSLTDDLWGQFWLAATAAGLNFCGKGGLSEQQRLGALIFAAAHLKRYCEKFGVPLPVDFAHLYEASHIGDEPGGRTVVSVSPMPATAEPEINLPVQPTRVIGREEETPEADDLLSDSRLDPRLNRDIGRVFVGRQRELAELTAALEEAVSGHGRLFMLVGEPGIGKTRTTQELASYAENRGAKVFWGRCYEEEGAPPYWPWVQIMRSYVQQASAEQLTTEMGAGAADIAEIVPEIRVKLPDLETPPVLEPEAARFRLFDSITTFLKDTSQSQPLMLVLDDLHWADRSSLLLLEFLAREMGSSRLLLVGCYRDTELSRQHPLAETAARLSREPVFRRQVLGGLGQDELGRFVEATTG
ncbi:MAG: ATP-binding protein, partial [Chloroflexi bacterium]|nr:ATP-binding protein [Chloroflexota bacterium]